MIKLPRLKRKHRILRNIFFTLFIVSLWLIAIDFSSFTPESAFRKLEKSYFSGPSDIITIMDGPNSVNSKVIISSYQDHIQISTIFKNYSMWKGEKLNSYKKHGDITVIPYSYSNFHNASIFAISNLNESVRAELTIRFQYPDENDKKMATEFTYEGQKLSDGLYYFPIEDQYADIGQDIGYLLFMLGQIPDKWTNSNFSYPIQLRFYSKTGELIKEETTLELSSDYLYGS